MAKIILMKRITKLNILNLILIIIGVVLIILQLKINLIYIDKIYFCFAVFLILIGVSLFYKFMLFNSDSSLWLSINLIGVGINIFSLNALNLDYLKFGVTFLISPIIASLFVGHIFKDVLQLKVVGYLIVMAITLYLFGFNIVKWYFSIIIFIVGELFLAIMFKYLPKILKRNKG